METTAKKLPVKVLIVPHFEIGDMRDDYPGEAQKFFEEYLNECDAYSVISKTTLWYNHKNKTAMYLSGVGKVNAAITTTRRCELQNITNVPI